jgi:hypothetical protein
MRFEHAAAYAMGVGLPLLEVLRRRTNFSPLHAYVDDLLAGALLLVAARAATHGRANADAWLAGAWGILCGGLYGSFFWQLERMHEVVVGGSAGAVVVAVKGILYAIAIAAFVCSLRRAARRPALG